MSNPISNLIEKKKKIIEKINEKKEKVDKKIKKYNNEICITHLMSLYQQLDDVYNKLK